MNIHYKLECLSTGKPLKPSLMFAGKVRTGAYPKGAPFFGNHLALLANIILGFKGFPGTNTLAY
jgi:hypothetical protein